MVVTVLAGFYAFEQTPRYQATAEVIRETQGYESSLLGVSALLYLNQQRIPVDARILASPDMAQRVKERIGSDRSAQQLLTMIQVSPLPETQSISVRAVSRYGDEAAAVANGFAETFVASRTEDLIASIESARVLLEEQLAQVPAAEQEEAYAVALKDRLKQLSVLDYLALSDYRVLQPAIVPGAPFEPQPIRDTALAFVVALVAAIAVAFLVEYLDRRIRDEEEMERAFGLPVLTSIPMVGRSQKRSKGAVGGSEAITGIGFRGGNRALLEPYMLLRSNLQYVSIDKEMRVLMITSTLPQHGKTTVSINLGFALALAGQRVVIVECDLRRPKLHEYLGLENEVGLTNVLAGKVRLLNAVQPVKVDDFVDASGYGDPRVDQAAQRNLYVLTSGPLPPNPSELMASKRMAEMIELAAGSGADYVLIDTPPVLVVADALSIATHVDGVIVAAKVRATKRDEAEQARTLIDRVGAHLLGVVVSGGKRTRRGYYHYGYGYARRYGRGYGYDDLPDSPAPAMATAAGQAARADADTTTAAAPIAVARIAGPAPEASAASVSPTAPD